MMLFIAFLYNYRIIYNGVVLRLPELELYGSFRRHGEVGEVG